MSLQEKIMNMDEFTLEEKSKLVKALHTQPLELSSYERDNLALLLDLVMTEAPFNTINNGDWVGQIRYKLDNIERGYGPNVPRDDVLKRAYQWRDTPPLTENERKVNSWAKQLINQIDSIQLDFDNYTISQEFIKKIGSIYWTIKHLRDSIE